MMDERDIERLLAHDFSAGTEEFRENLLNRCLDELNIEVGEIPLDDEALDYVAGGGGPSQYMGPNYLGIDRE